MGVVIDNVENGATFQLLEVNEHFTRSMSTS